jgi:3-dehydroquinate synthetase
LTGASQLKLPAETFEIDRVTTSEPVSYSVHLGSGVLEACFSGVLDSRSALVVTTSTAFSLHGERLLAASGGRLTTDDVLILDCTESNKDMSQVLKVCDRAVSSLDRHGVVIGFGGGVVMDIACFASSMIRRGIAHCNIPTTLVGQIDAGIGVKGGVNLGVRKSFVGCFRPPLAVLIEPAFLASLPSHHLSAGLAEMIKMAVIADKNLFEMICSAGPELVRSKFASPAAIARTSLVRSIALMLSELRTNIFETATLERKVDFGHTFSPTLESAVDFTIPHGFAVSIDIVLSTAISRGRGLLDDRDARRIAHCLANAGLPVRHPALTAPLCRKAIEDAARHRGGRPNLVLPMGIGDAAFVRDTAELSDSEIEAALDWTARLSAVA